jgi:uncharacterized protein (DUF1684 family)
MVQKGIVITMDAQHLLEVRAHKDEFFKTHPNSPLSSKQKVQFEGLTYFMPEPTLDLVVDVHTFDKPQNVQVQTTTGEIRWYLRWGEFTFDVDGEEVRLTLYKMPPDHFFLPFVDALAGSETYPAGRYLEPEIRDDGRFHIDFNQAYNPYCAYSPHWSCPITPTENRLKVAIRAGEKLPSGDWIIEE